MGTITNANMSPEDWEKWASSVRRDSDAMCEEREEVSAELRIIGTAMRLLLTRIVDLEERFK